MKNNLSYSNIFHQSSETITNNKTINCYNYKYNNHNRIKSQSNIFSDNYNINKFLYNIDIKNSFRSSNNKNNIELYFSSPFKKRDNSLIKLSKIRNYINLNNKIISNSKNKPYYKYSNDKNYDEFIRINSPTNRSLVNSGIFKRIIDNKNKKYKKINFKNSKYENKKETDKFIIQLSHRLSNYKNNIKKNDLSNFIKKGNYFSLKNYK